MAALSRSSLVRTALLIAGLGLGSCWKQPIEDVNALFTLADAVWFAEEETLFVFYRIRAEQGLRPESDVEIRWTTDDEIQDWAPLSAFQPVHTHLPVDCGYTRKCGSTSIHVPIEPRQVQLRLRYHRDGEMFLDTQTYFYSIGPGDAHRNRSLLVYGVFDEPNLHVQWRARHTFPNLRNMEVEALGLRRFFRVSAPGYGAEVPPIAGNPYAYAYDAACDPANIALGWPPIETTDRAIFDTNQLPLDASDDAVVCGVSRVTDATPLGTFDGIAVARKNPEVRAAFAALKSPIKVNSTVEFFLEPCDYSIDEDHREMQEQRLLLADAPVICTDAWDQPGFENQLAATIQNAVDIARAEGNDMVITMALHHDHPGPTYANVIEGALEQVVSAESIVSSPHVSGAFVFDSYSHSILDANLKQLALWCPADIAGSDLDDIPAESERSCPILPDIPDLVLGPFKLNTMPILSTREQYLTFIEKYGKSQAGKMKTLRFLAPERSPISENVQVGEFGVITFFDDETISADPEDAFSFCALDPIGSIIAFRTDTIPIPAPLFALPQLHLEAPEPTYQLGLFWEFPFLVRLEYEVIVAGSVSAVGATVPFGVAGSNRSYYGAELWRTGTFPLDEVLKQCDRWCDHATFDSAGVYDVLRDFRTTYFDQCYEPLFPQPGDGGFPIDP